MTNSEKQRLKRIKESVDSMAKTKEHYANFLKRRALNIKNKVAPSHIVLDDKGFRV